MNVKYIYNEAIFKFRHIKYNGPHETNGWSGFSFRRNTKVPIILGHGMWGFSLPHADIYNFWSFAHEARTDFAMWLGSLFLLIKGGGCSSIDRLLSKPKPK